MVYKLFACCIPVKGYRRSIIVDTQRMNYFIIPNGLYEILINNECYSPEKIKKELEFKYNKVINEYFEFLLNNDLIFSCAIEQINCFPKLSLKWDAPHHIINAIIDVNEKSQHDYNSIFNQLSNLLCKHIEIRFFNKVTLSFISEILLYSDYKSFQSIDIILPYSIDLSIVELNKVLDKYSRLTNIVIFNSPDITEIKNEGEDKGQVLFIKNKIVDCTSCGEINPSSFTMNLDFFCEVQTFNSCLNRKISIDVTGQIKNCPSMAQSFGNIKNTSLENVVNNKEFKCFRNIKKDDIEVCKDCEYRYICSDCRVYVRGHKDVFSQPAKCKYNPYIAKWEGEKDYVSIEQKGS